VWPYQRPACCLLNILNGETPDQKCDELRSSMCVRAITLSISGNVTFSHSMMTRNFKFVAAVLAFVFVASTLSVFGACLRGNAVTMSKCCGPRCPMMMKAQSVGSAFQANSSGAPCCNMSPAKPTSASVLQAPCNRLLVVPVLADAPFGSALPVPKTELCAGVPPDRSSPPLAVLCSFLI
jgi:hypothetical protein